ncbi:G2/mitotic-specific cyclin-B-like [Brevipalpus obovatus]|uniref:G2/mitotic-specific cyclin-B-like n=1 Tax=Brevipalpus obovatus TaxID=246614 RepID=UPI003D9EE8D9
MQAFTKLSFKSNVENKATNLALSKRTAPLNSSLISKPKRTAFNNLNNVVIDVVTNKLVDGTAKLSLKSTKDYNNDEGDLKKKPITNVVVKAKELPKPAHVIVRNSTANTKPNVKPSAIVKSNSNPPSADADTSQSRIPRLVKAAKSRSIGYSSSLIPVDVENIDQLDGDNTFQVSEYVNDIYSYLRQLERKYAIKQNPLSSQKEYSSNLRMVLVDWLITIHHQFKLCMETYFMTIQLIDRYCQLEQVPKKKIQLVGVTGLFIASKFEEIYPPEMEEILRVCDGIYTKKDIIRMEISMLKTLNFDICRPLPIHFLRRWIKAAHADACVYNMSKYLMELCSLFYECTHWDPSVIAAAALYISRRILNNNQPWTRTLEFYTRYSEDQLKSYVSIISKIILKIPDSKYQSCRKKYFSVKFNKVSRLPELESSVISDMATGKFSPVVDPKKAEQLPPSDPK